MQVIPALRFKQWLPEWDEFAFDKKLQRRKPEPYLYLFSMKASQLRALSDVYRRAREEDDVVGIQRGRDDSRTSRILRYVKDGYPYGDLKPVQRTEDMKSFRKPGWLPTAIVVNILTSADARRGQRVKKEHLIRVIEGKELFGLEVPDLVDDDQLKPFEVIDGQHRLWAFDPIDGQVIPDDFELPVVAFYGLDVAWQAYLFWSINVSPKRINPSHAFDLYPLLRTQDWLERFGELQVYREARAQEITEVLFSLPASAWYSRINMLGEKGGGSITQAAWVRSLSSTFFSTGRGKGRPGLFNSALIGSEEPLPWSRSQQAAFLVENWNSLRDAVRTTRAGWARHFEVDGDKIEAFSGKQTFLYQDVGIRAVLAVINDVFYLQADDWKLSDWYIDKSAAGDTDLLDDVSKARKSLRRQAIHSKIELLAEGLSTFDWRTAEAEGLTQNERDVKRSFRGSGGYTALKVRILQKLISVGGELREPARIALSETGA